MRLARSTLVFVAVLALTWFAMWLVLVAINRPQEYGFGFSIELPAGEESQSLHFAASDAEALGLVDRVVEVPPGTARSERIWISTSLSYVDEEDLSYCFRDEIVLSGAERSEVIATPGLCVDRRDTTIERALEQPIQIDLRVESQRVDAVRLSPTDAAALGATEDPIPVQSVPARRFATIPTALEYDLSQRSLEYCFRDPVIGLDGTEEVIVVYSGTCMRSTDYPASPLQFVSG